MPLRITLPPEHHFDKAAIEEVWFGPWPGPGSPEYRKRMKNFFKHGHSDGRTDALNTQEGKRFYPAAYVYPECDWKIGPMSHFVMAYVLGYSVGMKHHQIDERSCERIMQSIYAPLLRQLIADGVQQGPVTP